MRRRVASLAVLFLGVVLASTESAVARDLTIEDRVRAQEAIERVYYSHQIGATKPFDEAVPRSVLQHKVRTYLKESVALERIWRTPVTAEALRRELERIVRETRMPDRLRDLFDGLRNDPILIQECLARPILVDRLARSFFTADQRIHAAARRRTVDLRFRLVSGMVDLPRGTAPPAVVEVVKTEKPNHAQEGAGQVKAGQPNQPFRLELD